MDANLEEQLPHHKNSFLQFERKGSGPGAEEAAQGCGKKKYEIFGILKSNPEPGTRYPRGGERLGANMVNKPSVEGILFAQPDRKGMRRRPKKYVKHRRTVKQAGLCTRFTTHSKLTE